MVPKHIGNGRGGTGLLAYLLHDAVSADARHPATSDRVAWTATSGSLSDDVRVTMRIMQGLVADAPILKRRSGVSLKGRRATKPYAHLVFSWPANQRPDREQQVVAVKSALQSQGLQDHLAILVAHDDTAHHHVHVIACRVAETGRTNAMGRSGVKLSAWAEKYEREHGGIVIPTRVERSRQRAEFRTKVDKLMQDFSPPADLSPTAQARERAGARKAAVTKLRETGQHPLHPRQRPRVPGRAPFSLAERHAWRACLATQDGTNPKAERAERVALRAQLDAERVERKAAQAREREQAARNRRQQRQSPDVGWGR